MRFLVLAALLAPTVARADSRVAVAATTAHAHGDRVREAAPPRTPKHLTLRLRAEPVSPLAVSLRTHKVAPPRELEMPAVWRQLRGAVYSRMPKVEKPTFSFVAAPVIVDGTYDSVPGVGLAGAF